MGHTILIPSYKRHDRLTTLDLFQGLGRDNVVISTQCEEDYALYSERYGDRATVIFRKTDSVGGNRNTLLEWCSDNSRDEAIMFDDDVDCFQLMDGRTIRDLQGLLRIIDLCHEQAVATGSPIWGAYPVCNTFFMKRKVSYRNIICGTIIGFTDTTLRFDERYKTKEDYELSLRLIEKGFPCLRFDWWAPKARHHSKGGCEDEWKNGDTGLYARALASRYPGLCQVNPRKQQEIIYIGK